MAGPAVTESDLLRLLEGIERAIDEEEYHKKTDNQVHNDEIKRLRQQRENTLHKLTQLRSGELLPYEE